MNTEPHTSPPEGGDSDSLTLADDSNLVGPKRFGELVAKEQGREKLVKGELVPHPYTSQSVTNWCKDCRATPTKVDERGWKLFDPSHAAVVAQNIPQPTRGGVRSGSGRRKTKAASKAARANTSDTETNADGTDESLADRMRAIEQGHDAVEAWKTRIAGDEPLEPSEAMEISETLSWTEDEFRKAMAVFTVGPQGLSPAKMGVLDKWLSIRERQQKFNKEAGKLVELDTVGETIAQINAPVVEMLDALPRTLTESLAPRCWINEGVVDRIIGTLYGSLSDAGVDPDRGPIRDALDLIRSSLTRPLGLDAAIRAIVDQTVGSSQRTLIEELESQSTGSTEGHTAS